ncbi:exp1-like protein [Physocladia obscura]|uniref:Exp1-like protein n=1 Tax=Physocladia obscura TaxID=109957 RepID=A0AAD5SWA6_9FUNG|nr:exp1-like protein [Physocladia obscura]
MLSQWKTTTLSLRFAAASHFASSLKSVSFARSALTASFASGSKAPVDPQKEKITLARRKLRAIKTASVSVTQPKRPPSAYIIFWTEKSHELLKSTEIQALPAAKRLPTGAALAGKLWTAASNAEKKIYENRASDARVAYKKALDEYLKARTPADLVVERRTRSLKQSVNPNAYVAPVPADPKAPKFPANAQNLFLKDFKYAGTPTEKLKAAVTEWKNLSEESKKPYVLEASKLKAAYIEAKIKYEQATGISEIRKTLEKELHIVTKKPKAKKDIKKVVKKLSVRKIATKKSGAKKPASKKSVAKKPASKKLPSKKPAPKKPTVKKPTAKKIVAKKPVTKKAAAKKPIKTTPGVAKKKDLKKAKKP